jgi:4'-phosphopantetheinyl transferase
MRQNRSVSRIAVHFFSTRFKEADCGTFTRILSAEELARAARFHFEVDRVRSIVCRAMLRRLAAALCGEAPERIEFSLVKNGKPTIVHPAEAAKIHVNVSHSGELGAVALSRDAPVGVDVEFMRPDIEIAAMAKHYFRHEECRWLASLPEAHQLRGFHRLWVLKEAILKASGDGLSIPLDSIPVDIQGEVVKTGPRPAIELPVAGNYCAAVSANAMQMPAVELSVWPDDCLV